MAPSPLNAERRAAIELYAARAHYHSHDAIRDLLREIERLEAVVAGMRAEVDRLTAELDKLRAVWVAKSVYDDMREQRDAARAEAAAMREWIDGLEASAGHAHQVLLGGYRDPPTSTASAFDELKRLRALSQAVPVEFIDKLIWVIESLGGMLAMPAPKCEKAADECIVVLKQLRARVEELEGR